MGVQGKPDKIEANRNGPEHIPWTVSLPFPFSSFGYSVRFLIVSYQTDLGAE